MARVSPFRAHRYHPLRVGSLENVVTPPYDRITPAEWEASMRRHPHNFVRVIKNRNYRQAAGYLEEWIAKGIVVRDREPAFYPYQQEFPWGGERASRLGVVALLDLERDQVEGHERTYEGPVEDRLELMRACRANTGLVFLLYSDPAGEILKTLREATQQSAPLVAFEQGEFRHRLWQLQEKIVQNRIREALAGSALYLADGHHRFETSMRYCRECREAGWVPAAPESFDKRLVALFSLSDPGLRILPTHRGLKGLEDLDFPHLLSRIREIGAVDPVVGLAELEYALGRPEPHFGLIGPGGRPYLVSWEWKRLEDPAFMPAVEGPLRRVPAQILEAAILTPLLGIGTTRRATDHVCYYREAGELEQAVRQGKCELGFLLQPVPVSRVVEVAARGERMPQKSTDFYPKLPSGLVLMKMEMEPGSAS